MAQKDYQNSKLITYRRSTTLTPSEQEYLRNMSKKQEEILNKLYQLKFLKDKNEKVYGFYDPQQNQIYLTEELLNSNTLVHEMPHW
jgi:hypothetical protein